MASQPLGISSSLQDDDVSSSDDSELFLSSEDNPETDVSRFEISPTPRSPPNFTKREEFLMALERTERRTCTYQLKLNEQQTPETRDKVRYMMPIFNDIIVLIVNTTGELGASKDADIPSIESQFYEKLMVLNHKLNTDPGPHHHQDRSAASFDENRRKMIERSHDIENEMIKQDVCERYPGYQNLFDRLLREASVEFDRFRECVSRATTNEEIEKLEGFVYFGHYGTITKLKEQIEQFLNRQ